MSRSISFLINELESQLLSEQLALDAALTDEDEKYHRNQIYNLRQRIIGLEYQLNEEDL